VRCLIDIEGNASFWHSPFYRRIKVTDIFFIGH
jgi:hypothetical protein